MTYDKYINPEGKEILGEQMELFPIVNQVYRVLEGCRLPRFSVLDNEPIVKDSEGIETGYYYIVVTAYNHKTDEVRGKLFYLQLYSGYTYLCEANCPTKYLSSKIPLAVVESVLKSKKEVDKFDL